MDKSFRNKLLAESSQRRQQNGNSAVSLPMRRRPLTPVVSFTADELVKGGLHSSTSWTESYILRDIRLSKNENTKRKTQPHRLHNRHLQQDARETLRDHIYDSELGYHYVIKHIQRQFMNDHLEFEVAASYLEQEATILQRLDHQNISKLRGTAAGGVEAYFKAGGTHCDAYFLILDRIFESMEQRIKRWKRKHTRRNLSLRFRGWLSVGGGDASRTSAMTKVEETFYCERLMVARQIADALDYMHQQKIAYRSFGMDKVGFSYRNEVQLIELGDAEFLEDKNPRKELSNTSRLLSSSQNNLPTKDCVTFCTSPEHVHGNPLTDKADSYSFSKVFSAILTLIVLGPNLTPRELQAYASEFQRVTRRLPRETLDLLERGTDRDPNKRPTLRAYCEGIDLAMSMVERRRRLLERSSSLPMLLRRGMSMTGRAQQDRPSRPHEV